MKTPPSLTADEMDNIQESIEERSAIRQFDGGEDRATAEAKAASAMRVYRLLVSMGEGEEPRWLTMLAPGTDLPEAERIARLKFPGRVLAVIPHTPLSTRTPTVPAAGGCGHL